MGIQNEDTFRLGGTRSLWRIFFSIRRIGISLLYVVRWTFGSEKLDIKIIYNCLFITYL